MSGLWSFLLCPAIKNDKVVISSQPLQWKVFILRRLIASFCNTKEGFFKDVLTPALLWLKAVIYAFEYNMETHGSPDEQTMNR